jgi:hypothetical protein
MMHLYAQKGEYLTFAFTDQASAYPFSTFFGFFKEPVHPGFEAGWNQTIKEKKKHDWYREFKLGYFYHRFVQHGLPVYVNYGYRYKFSKEVSAEAALGGGYFHSIPATEVLKLQDDGEYKNAKGIGRPQVLIAFTMGAGYHFHFRNNQPIKLFLQYQQRIQTPFVRSYVPILPYNQIAVGVSIPKFSTKKAK